jgi:hypothetical protein
MERCLLRLLARPSHGLVRGKLRNLGLRRRRRRPGGSGRTAPVKAHAAPSGNAKSKKPMPDSLSTDRVSRHHALRVICPSR